MTVTVPDLSNLPTSSVDEGEFYAWTVPIDVGRLQRMRAAIDRWGKISAEELALFEVAMPENRTPIWDEFGYDPATDEAIELADVERAMYATLGVAIASSAENFIRNICKRRGIPLIDDEGESDFGIICANFNRSFETRVCSLPGYAGNQRARLLGNCFKHNDGETDSRFERKFRTPAGEAIDYENEDWDQMIADTGTLLNELCKLLSKPNKKIVLSASSRKRLIRFSKRVSGWLSS